MAAFSSWVASRSGFDSGRQSGLEALGGKFGAGEGSILLAPRVPLPEVGGWSVGSPARVVWCKRSDSQHDLSA